jgi:hypothetical protein
MILAFGSLIRLYNSLACPRAFNHGIFVMGTNNPTRSFQIIALALGATDPFRCCLKL